jgi:ubiquitin C-terminal hydrolase
MDFHGIINIGNSCYLNSALQLIFNSSDFRNIITNTILQQYIDEYDTSQIYNPTNIKSLVASVCNTFANFNQQDSYEFLVYLLDIVDKTIKNKELYNKFGIETTINIKCKMLKCLKESEHKEIELFLHLPMENDLSEAYRKYKNVEKLENENAYACENCKVKTIARKKSITSKWPDNLIIVLKRFDHLMRKDSRKVNIPLTWRHGYKLKGAIIHMGSYSGGHYIYYGEKNGEWFFANDSKISQINDINKFMEYEGQQSYILYYKQSL